MKLMHAAVAAGFGLSMIASMAESSLFSAFRSPPDGEQAGSGRSREQLEQIIGSVRQRVAGDPKHACEIVKQSIREWEAGPRLVVRIVEAVAMEVPEQMRLVSQCAVAVAPDALELVMELMARLDPNAGEALSAAKGGMSKSGPKGTLEVAPARANPLDKEEALVVIPSTNAGIVSWGWVNWRDRPGIEELGELPADERPGRPLNVVFIVADDLGYGDLGCYGQRKIKTPNIDRLARHGTRLTGHYAGAPADGASRSVLLSGRHLGGAKGAGGGYHRPTGAAASLAGAFRSVGYQTAAIGDWGLESAAGSPGAWGFGRFYGSRAVDQPSSYPAFLLDGERRVAINKAPVPAEARQAEGQVSMDKWTGENYAPDLMVGEAVKFIQANRDRPFFLYLSLPEPRAPLQPPKEELDRYPLAWDSEPYRGDNGGLPHPRPRAAYAAAVSRLDRHVGQVTDTLAGLGLERDTIVVLTSDNGAVDRGNPNSAWSVGGVDTAFFNSNGGLRGAKGSLYEGGIRVPAIVSMPGRVPGSRNRTAGYFADWLPTLCTAARLPVPAGTDGENLWDGLAGGASSPRSRPMVWTSRRFGGQVAVRLGDYKVIRQGLNTGQAGPWEVYDIARDEDESANLASGKPELIDQAVAVLKSELGPGSAVPVSKISR